MKLFLVVFILFTSLLSFSQVKDSIEAIDTSYHHSPKKAVIFSAIIPVSGQVYNHIHFEKGQSGKRNIFWKLPLFYSALGYTAYSLIKNQGIQRDLKAEYYYRQNNNNSTLDQRWTNYDAQGIVSLTKEYEGKRDFSILLFGAAYLIQLIDAGIEAHFVSFDISQDLTLNIQPKIITPQVLGLGLSVNIKENTNSFKLSKL
jgi:hypothetical protein